jgi:hypothetical protein
MIDLDNLRQEGWADAADEIARLRAVLEDLATGTQHREVMVRKARAALANG